MQDENNNLVVIKANDLIQNYKYTLSKSELRIVNMIISNINSPLYDEKFNMMKFRISDFYTLLGWNNIGGNDYRRLKAILKRLSDSSSDYIQIGDKETIVRWIEKPYFDKKYGTVELKLDDDLKPFLLQAKGYIQAQLKYYFQMESQYSMRVYELLKSWEGVRVKEFTVEEFRSLIDAENGAYENFGKLRQSVLDCAVKEINEITDLYVSYEPRKTGRKYTHLKFTILKKTGNALTSIDEHKEDPNLFHKIDEEPGVDADNELHFGEEIAEETINEYEPETSNEYDPEEETLIPLTPEEEEREIIAFYQRYGILAEEYPQFSKDQIKALHAAACRNIDTADLGYGMLEIAVSDYIMPKWQKILATPEQTKTTEFLRLLNMVENNY